MSFQSQEDNERATEQLLRAGKIPEARRVETTPAYKCRTCDSSYVSSRWALCKDCAELEEDRWARSDD